jgi:aspartate-semialdehyde dehydrogenase
VEANFVNHAWRIAVVGATGLVGQTLLEVLGERRHIAVAELRPLATEGDGRTVTFRGETLKVRRLSEETLRGVEVAFFAATNAVSAEWAPRVAAAGGVAIDKSSYFRMDPAVPLVVPEVNGEVLARRPRIIASPNCSTIQLVMALEPIRRRRRVTRVLVSTYQAVSGSGRDAMQQLEAEVRAWSRGEPPPAPTVYPYPIAGNVLPYCDRFGDLDYTGEEWKLVRESAKIFGEDLRVSATAVRVPVMVGHAESVYVECDRPVSPAEARAWLDAFPGVRVVDDPASGRVPTPRDAAGQDAVLVGRIRRDPHVAEGLHLFVVADNLRKGAASNAVDILEHLEEAR